MDLLVVWCPLVGSLPGITGIMYETNYNPFFFFTFTYKCLVHKLGYVPQVLLCTPKRWIKAILEFPTRDIMTESKFGGGLVKCYFHQTQDCICL